MPVGKSMNHSNIDPSEIQKFEKLASEWWDPEGELKTLHDINPLRLSYILKRASLQGKKILDIGCGGGILCESMAKAGGIVTGIDMSEKAIAIAKSHLRSRTSLSSPEKRESIQMDPHLPGDDEDSGNKKEIPIEYLVSTAEDFAEQHKEEFDIVTCLELLEHVPDPTMIVKAAFNLLKPNGDIFFSTINRNMKSYLFAIIGAEYLLKMIPQNTHDFAKFIRPSELTEWARKVGLKVEDITGMTYNILTREYKLSEDVSVNYLMYLKK